MPHLGYQKLTAVATLVLVLVAACSKEGGAERSAADSSNELAVNTERPNILLIVADDLGYADLGILGSDIRTPNIDRLAREGVRFSQFRTAPFCAPTRAMLLSGNNNHVAGMGNQMRVVPKLADVPGYEKHLSDRIEPLPRLLKEAGYHTYMAGKWHLGHEEEQSPAAAGFERSFALIEGGASHFDGRGFENHPSRYRQDGKLADWPQDAYSTEFYTDTLIEYIDSQSDDGKPFFAYATYTSPHWPLQVPEAELDRYEGAYDDGYDALREKNFRNLQTAGVVSADLSLPPRNPSIAPWSDLDAEQRRREARKMELYAAMVENLDHHVGRLLDYLRDTGRYENTLVVFMGDNGAAGWDPIASPPFGEFLRANYPNRFEDWGGPESFVAYGAPWAEAGSAPYKYYKSYTTEGGMAAPMIISGAGVASKDTISHTYVTVMDLAPTFAAVAGANSKGSSNKHAMLGVSLLPYLAATTNTVHPPGYVTVLEHNGRAMLRRGDWKLVSVDPPFDESQFGLYDIATDPAETTDLSSEFPEKKAELLELWREQRDSLGIILEQDL